MKYISEKLILRDPPNVLNVGRLYHLVYYTGLEMYCVAPNIQECIKLLKTGKNVKSYQCITSWKCLCNAEKKDLVDIKSYINRYNTEVIETANIIAYVDNYGFLPEYYVQCKDTLQSVLLSAY
jgi:hypothetical protein